MSVSPNFAVYEAKIATVKALANKAAPANNRMLFDALAAAGIAVVETGFDGGGDESQTESTAALISENTEITSPDVGMSFAEVVWAGPSLIRTPHRVRHVIQAMAYMQRDGAVGPCRRMVKGRARPRHGQLCSLGCVTEEDNQQGRS